MKTVTSVYAIVEAPLVTLAKLCGIPSEKVQVFTERPLPPFSQQEITMLLDGLEAFGPHLTVRELGIKQDLLNKLARYLPNGTNSQT